MELRLERPIIVFDLETTGMSITHDRIVEISLIKVYPDGKEEVHTRRINPGMHIPEEASAVHHIFDEDVAEEPRFENIAASLYEIFDGCDIAGFNSNKFDVPLLIEEFARAGMRFEISGRRFVDVLNIFHKMEQRTLAAAYRYYCGKDLENAHSAAADALATYEVLKSQLDMYDELENNVDALDEFSGAKTRVDLAGRIILNDKGEEIFNFGKHKGHKVQDVVRDEPAFINWVLDNDFPLNTKNVLMGLRGKYDPRKKK